MIAASRGSETAARSTIRERPSAMSADAILSSAVVGAPACRVSRRPAQVQLAVPSPASGMAVGQIELLGVVAVAVLRSRPRLR